MMRMIFIPALAGLTLAGCVTKASVMRDIQSGFVGKPLSHATALLGPGQRSDNSYVWQKEMDQALFVPTITSTGGSIGPMTSSSTVGHSIEKVLHRCSLTLTVDAAAIVTAATTRGDMMACGLFTRR